MTPSKTKTAMNEKATKEEAQTVPGTSGLQRQAQGSSELQKVITECEQAEADLYARRGYGGYIKTEHLDAIRATKQEAKEKLQSQSRSRTM